jgi:formiminotetrahydrofolate cyclodeaminase
MRLVDNTIIDFLNKVDSKSATPGGGSVAALSLAEGISLIRMVGHLSLTKKKYLTASSDIQTDYQKRMEELLEFKEVALNLIDEDTLAFNKIMDAYGLSKVTEEEISYRDLQIHEATIHATDVPFQTAKIAAIVIEIIEPMYKYAAKSATSDFGVGVQMILSGFISARLNVMTNMQGFADLEVKNDYLQKVEEYNQKVTKVSEELLCRIFEDLSK